MEWFLGSSFFYFYFMSDYGHSYGWLQGSNPKRLSSCYKSLKMHKNKSKINGTPKPKSTNFLWLCLCNLIDGKQLKN